MYKFNYFYLVLLLIKNDSYCSNYQDNQKSNLTSKYQSLKKYAQDFFDNLNYILKKISKEREENNDPDYKLAKDIDKILSEKLNDQKSFYDLIDLAEKKRIEEEEIISILNKYCPDNYDNEPEFFKENCPQIILEYSNNRPSHKWFNSILKNAFKKIYRDIPFDKILLNLILDKLIKNNISKIEIEKDRIELIKKIIKEKLNT